MRELIVAVLGYHLGMIQGSFLLVKLLFNQDIRDRGNGNAGASNALLVYGKWIGILTAIIDIAKAFLAVALVRFFVEPDDPSLINLIYIAGTAVIIGHNFPYYMGFKGGKGTASLIGLCFGIDLRLGIASAFVIVFIALISNYIAIGTIALLGVFASFTIMHYNTFIPLMCTVVICTMSIYKHLPNMANIRNGTEKLARTSLMNK